MLREKSLRRFESFRLRQLLITMSFGPEAIKNYGQPEEDNLSDLFGEEEVAKVINRKGALSEEDLERMLEGYDALEGKTKELTPEHVAKVWETLSDIEKKFVTCSQEQFDSIIPEYGNKHGKKKAGVVQALRKLLLVYDPRAALIESKVNI